MIQCRLPSGPDLFAAVALLIATAGLSGLVFFERNSPPGVKSNDGIERPPTSRHGEERAKARRLGQGPLSRSPSEAAHPDTRPFADVEAARRGRSRQPVLPFFDRFDAAPQETVLQFAGDSEYRAFLERAEAEGVTVLGRVDALRAVRIRREGGSAIPLPEGTAGFTPEPNFLVQIPRIPYRVEDRAEPGTLVGFGAEALRWLGLPDDNFSLGEGITVAVIDGGIEPVATTFGNGQVEVFPLDSPKGPVGTDSVSGSEPGALAHGTGVASIIAGRGAETRGVAPGARLLSFKVMGENGVGNSFALAEAIVQATDAGARVINMSLGGYSESGLVGTAVEYAASRGVALVAAAGNETYSEVAYPARFPEVIAVGAVDGLGQQLPFSNSGRGLDLTAPGLAVQVAWPGGEQLGEVSGTSASAPFVSGAIAAVLSQFPDLNGAGAAALLAATSNEAGAPGPDAAYGAGILYVGRALQSRTRGIVDAAVASHFPTRDERGQRVIQVVVENRGTETMHNLQLSVDLAGRAAHRTIPFLAPGQSDFRELPLPRPEYLRAETLFIESRLTRYGRADANPGNDSRRTAIHFPEEE